MVFVGELFPEVLVREIANAEVKGKVSLGEYASLLRQSGIGLSLMISPHPSYPPLEMAYAGCVTVTNTFEAKNLGLRSDNIISIDSVNPETVAEALCEALMTFEAEPDRSLSPIESVPSAIPPYDAEQVLKALMGDAGV
ncbi:MAG: hypothetical protein U5K56_02270 [Halioglobus sp.]|nr:hypothetical protein [Halioglobus sp.]